MLMHPTTTIYGGMEVTLHMCLIQALTKVGRWLHIAAALSPESLKPTGQEIQVSVNGTVRRKIPALVRKFTPGHPPH